MINYGTMSACELVDLLRARDTEIEILSASCQRLLKEKLKWENKVKEIVLDLGIELDDLFEKKDPDSGIEGSSLFPKGEGTLVYEGEGGKIHTWD